MRDDSGDDAPAEAEAHVRRAVASMPGVPGEESRATPGSAPEGGPDAAPDAARNAVTGATPGAAPGAMPDTVSHLDDATPPSQPERPRLLESQRIELDDIESNLDSRTFATITVMPPRPASETGRSAPSGPRTGYAPAQAAPEGLVPSLVPSLPSSRFPPGTVLAERYRIIHLLGRGGMGEVYRADDLKLAQPVALKFLPQSVEQEPERLARLLDEVKIARAIAHPNVCRVYDIDEVDGHHFLSMEYIDGENLSTLLRRVGRVPRDKAMELGIQICHGLAAVHAQGILHRDLKPANLMIDERGRVRIMDFGLASLSDGVDQNSISHGTPAYMAPEQLEGASVSSKSDLYALGLVLYQMFTGRPAFPGGASRDLVWRRLDSTPEPPSRLVDDIDLMVENAILRCLEPDPRDRPTSGLEVAEALAASAVPAADAVLKAVVVCDPGDRAAWAQELGEEIAAELWHQQLARAREIAAEHGGLALAGSSGLHLVFDRPVQAARFAIDYQCALPLETQERDTPVRARIGVHLGEVTFRHESAQTDSQRSLYPHVSPQARDTAVRLSTVASPGQILLTRSAFDLARQSNIEGVDEVRWLAHGSYEVDGLHEPIELFEVGVEGVSPLRPPQESKRARRQMVQSTVAGWRPAPGLEMPLRPHWAIERKLSEGGFGEVWLARHRKTHEPRVFKFCYDATSLRALQREITLFRLLKETLGERNDINRIFDWNFEESPYFIESAYTAGGDLAAWAAEQGGLPALPLATRLEIVAQVATALAAAHSVGVLHKDVKPANVLMTQDADGRVQILLSDFGIGHVTERQRLAEAGITVVGLTEPTETASHGSLVGGTRLYMAPEVLEGKPATVRADVYALGVMLFQMVVGDFARALAPGWERSVPDELLREDIGAAIDGFDQRLGDASALADRLRRLESRRKERAEQERQRVEAEQAKEALARGRRRRKYMLLLLAVVTVFAGSMVFQSQRVAREARAAEQVSDFLVELFEVADPYKAAGNQVTARQILDRGAARIETELQDQPAIRARLMHIMGVVYGNLGLYPEATSLLQQALDTRRKLHGDEHLDVAETQDALADVLADKYELAGAEELHRQALATRRKLLGDEHLLVADSRHGLALVLLGRDQSEQARPLAQEALSLRRQLLEHEHPDIAASLRLLGTVLMVEQAFDESEAALREAGDMYRKLLGNDALEVAECLHLLARAHLLQAEYDVAEELFEQSRGIKQRVLGENHVSVADALANQADLVQRRGDLPRAEALFQRALAIYRASMEGDRLPVFDILQALGRITAARGELRASEELAREAIALARELDMNENQVASTVRDLAVALHLQGRYPEAEEEYRRVLAIQERLHGAGSDHTIEASADLASLLIDAGKLDQAAPMMATLERFLEAGASTQSRWLPAHVRSVRGAYLGRTGELAQAEELLLQSHTALREQRGAYDRFVLMALHRLISFYEHVGNAERASEYRSRWPEGGVQQR
jgi:serine/threonine protein kinase